MIHHGGTEITEEDQVLCYAGFEFLFRIVILSVLRASVVKY
jgi:hypothetical protein